MNCRTQLLRHWYWHVQISTIEGVIRIGETLTVLVYIKDPDNSLDLLVRDCWAFDAEDYESPETTRLQLTDKQGCPK